MGEILAYISKEDANVGAEVCQPYAPMHRGLKLDGAIGDFAEPL